MFRKQAEFKELIERGKFIRSMIVYQSKSHMRKWAFQKTGEK